MAKRDKIDIVLNNRFEEFEKRLFVLKVEYDKYFSGIERVEPVRERDDLRRMLREMQQVVVTSTRQQHKLRSLRARFASMELFWQRNLVMIERGTHPKMKFRADLHDRSRGAPPAEGPRERRAPPSPEERERAAFQAVFDSYVEARKSCGQSADMSFESVRDVLQKQVRTIKSRYRCDAVKFRVTVEDGKAKVKAVPLK